MESTRGRQKEEPERSKGPVWSLCKPMYVKSELEGEKAYPM